MCRDLLLDKTSVLLVEDNVAVARETEQKLYALGFETVEVALTLDDAHALLEEQRFGMALLDINLTRGETTLELGWSLAAELIPIVFFSGFNLEEMTRLTRGHEVLEKPVSVPRLKAAMQRAHLRRHMQASGGGHIKMAGQMARQ